MAGFLEPVIHWLAVHTGTVNESGPYYGFWSGFGSDIGEVVLIGGMVHVAREFNCGQRGCKRIGRLHEWVDSNGVKHKLCRHHHPQLGPAHVLTANEIARHAAITLHGDDTLTP